MATSFRASIISRVCETLETLPVVRAAWLGGSAAFSRLDAYSDIDICAVVDQGLTAAVFGTVEQALDTVAPIQLRVTVPNTAGFSQRFYRFAGRSEFEVLDLALLPNARPPMFLEEELHGRPTVLFDRDNLVCEAHVDAPDDLAKAAARVGELAPWFEMFQHLAIKSRLRGNAAEALAFYQTYTMRPLVEALRIRHSPHRRNFHVRYLDRDVPPAVASRITHLSFVKDLDDLGAKQDEAIRWFREIIDDLSHPRST